MYEYIICIHLSINLSSISIYQVAWALEQPVCFGGDGVKGGARTSDAYVSVCVCVCRERANSASRDEHVPL